MITPEEIGEVAIFSSLASTDKERLSRAAADISLIAGEFAAQEGDERALFAVLDGRIEAVKTTDGIERVVGERQHGDVFGEVPIVLGTVFPVGFRAAEPTRAMRIEPAAYHSLSAVAPDVAREIGRLAAHRMGGSQGLQGLAADPPPPRAIIVGHRWDPACAALRRFLDHNQVTYRWITGEAEEETKAWEGALPNSDDWPAIRAVNGKTAVRPSPRRVAELLGMNTEPAEAIYDTVIVGAGPAGLAAAVYGASEGLRTIVVEREARAARPGPPHGSRTTSAFLQASPAMNWRAAPCNRRDGSGRRSSSPARSPASTRRAVSFTSMAATSCVPARSSSPAA